MNEAHGGSGQQEAAKGEENAVVAVEFAQRGVPQNSRAQAHERWHDVARACAEEETFTAARSRRSHHRTCRASGCRSCPRSRQAAGTGGTGGAPEAARAPGQHRAVLRRASAIVLTGRPASPPPPPPSSGSSTQRAPAPACSSAQRSVAKSSRA